MTSWWGFLSELLLDSSVDFLFVVLPLTVTDFVSSITVLHDQSSRP